MGRDGPILWPARSPDLARYDCYLWENIKNITYQDSPQNMYELKAKIRGTIRVIKEDTLKRVFKNMKTRPNFVIREKVGHFEHIMN